MNILFCKTESGYQISYPSSETSDHLLWEEFRIRLITLVFANHPVILITDTPQPYSFVSILDSTGISIKRDETAYRIDSLQNCPEDILKELADDEEFERGLLWICKPKEPGIELTDPLVQDELLSPANNTSMFESIRCTNDGCILFWTGLATNTQVVFDALKEHFTELNFRLVELP